MKRFKKKGFTLIELIAVLVIMAIIALIVTPLVMSIIKKAKVSADKRNIDAYGRSIELAIAGYLLDNGTFPTSIEQLTIEYSGEEVVCSTTQLNSDSSVYLSDCTVGGRSVEGYTYGKEETTPAPTYTAYTVGDHVSYNNVTYYVIEDSDATNDTVKLLKENRLNNREMGISDDENYSVVSFGSTNDYSTSTVKQYVDFWKNHAVKSEDIATARLISYDEIINNLEIELSEPCGTGCGVFINIVKTSWAYNNEYSYWIICPSSLASSDYCAVSDNRVLDAHDSAQKSVRPVLELNKSADISIIN